MNILVTAGNTQVFIDQVRCITNIFTGRTGAAIAVEAHRRGHRVTLLTSHPETVTELWGRANRRLPLGTMVSERWCLFPYKTFDDLRHLMEQRLNDTQYNAIIHSAAVTDYLPAGLFAPAPGTRFTEQNSWRADAPNAPALVGRDAAKVKSDDPELWLRLRRAPKLIDMVRAAWGFRGILVKFKLEVGVGDEQLLEVAEKSRVHSQADLMVANTLEGASSWAFIGPLDSSYVRISRPILAANILDAVENLVTKRR